MRNYLRYYVYTQTLSFDLTIIFACVDPDSNVLCVDTHKPDDNKFMDCVA